MAHINFSSEREALHEVIDRNNSAVHYSNAFQIDGETVAKSTLSAVYKHAYMKREGVMKW